MTAPTPNAALAAIRDRLVSFNWSNYGLDVIDEADTEWADALAQEIHAEIFGPRPDAAS